MKTRMVLSVLAAGLLLSFVSIKSATWSVDSSHARLGFSVPHLMVSEVEGSFKKFDATIAGTAEDFSDAVVTLKADVNSINTDNDQRDTHLKNPDFFDAAKYPTIMFTSKSFKKAGDKKYLVTGDLTMHGVTKQVQLDVVYNTGIHPMTKNTIAGFKVTGKIKRSDFNIGTSFLANIIGDEVNIVANAEFIKNNDAN
jgi:polyisoprenoid-binding protein YceI